MAVERGDRIAWQSEVWLRLTDLQATSVFDWDIRIDSLHQLLMEHLVGASGHWGVVVVLVDREIDQLCET